MRATNKDLLKVAAVVFAVLIVWNFGPAMVGWTWDHAVVPLARVIAGVEAPAPTPEAVIVPNTATGGVAAPAPDTKVAPAVATDEGEFIAGKSTTIAGPAIIQLWDGKTTAGCGIYQIPAGYQFVWALRGHYWLFEGVSENAFNEAFDASEAAFAASNPQCVMKPPLK